MKPWTRHRRRKLKSEGFSSREAKAYSELKFSRKLTRLLRKANRKGQLVRILDEKGKEGDPWATFRAWRDDLIDRGIWDPGDSPSKGTPHKKMRAGEIDREHISKQAKGYRATARREAGTKSGDKREWLRQLNERIAQGADEPARLAQFRAQRDRLERELG